MSRSIQAASGTPPVVDMEFGEGQTGQFKEPGPANPFNPFANPFPRTGIFLVKNWSKLAEDHKLDLVVCVAAGLRRGIKDEILAPGFRISGLGQLIEGGIQADRLVTFGD